MRHKKGNNRGSEENLETQEVLLASEEAEEELAQESGKTSEREYQRMAADLRWEVLEYLDAHPDKNVLAVADLFGLREGTIRAWKAHRTMGTYGPAEPKTTKRQTRMGDHPGRAARQTSFFPEQRKKNPSFLERKRYSNFIHYFDKTPPGIVCPHFFILAHANGCAYACDYCYLRLTLRHYPEPTVFTNTARLFQELRDWLLSREEPSVLNTGELSDSLAWDLETSLSSNLIPLFANQNRHKVLFLTKSTVIENLLREKPSPQVIASWSVNADAVSRKYERAAPTPEQRLAAAGKVKARGWPVRIRLDPLLPIPDWKDQYERIVDQVNQLAPEVVTIGSLRFFPNLLNHAPKNTDVFSFAKDHGDPDGRLRLPENLRLEMYHFVMERLENLRIGLCKETEKIHRELGLPGVNQSCNCAIV